MIVCLSQPSLLPFCTYASFPLPVWRAGNYTIRFSVTNSAGRSANITRTLLITRVCEPGQQLCANKVLRPKCRPACQALSLPLLAGPCHCGHALGTWTMA